MGVEGDIDVSIQTRFIRRINEGYGFSISHRFEGVAADGSVELYFENPANSGRKVYIVVVEVVSFAQAWIDIYRNNSVSSSGTKLVPVNLNFEKNIQSIVGAEYGGTYNLGSLVHSTVVPGGSQIRAIGGAVEVGESVIIKNGYNFIVKVTNKSSAASDLSIRVIWWEE